MVPTPGKDYTVLIDYLTRRIVWRIFRTVKGFAQGTHRGPVRLRRRPGPDQAAYWAAWRRELADLWW